MFLETIPQGARVKRNNTVYLLVGTRGAGKTTYAEALVANDQNFQIVSRDEILVRLFGSEHRDPYSGGIQWGMQVMSRIVRRKLATQNNLRLIFDR